MSKKKYLDVSDMKGIDYQNLFLKTFHASIPPVVLGLFDIYSKVFLILNFT
jgi:hypothetical protein